MSYDNAEARHLTLQPEKHWHGYAAKPIIAVEWFETEASQWYLDMRTKQLGMYFANIDVSVIRPSYGGWRYEFKGTRR